MKHFIILLIAGMLAISAAFGQFVITADNFPTTGSYSTGTSGDAVDFDVGSAGPNQIWTFGDYTWQSARWTDHLLPSDTPYDEDFPTATHADRSWNSGLEGAWYDYSQVIPDASCRLGEAWAWNDTVIVFDPPVCVPLPITYGSSGTVVEREHYEIGSDVYDGMDSALFVVDGWGTIHTPYVTAPALRLFVQKWHVMWVNGQVVDSSRNVQYGWFNEHFEAVVEARSEDGVTDPNFSIGSLEMMGVPMAADDRHDRTAHSFCMIQNYPNPFNGTTTISFSLLKASAASLKVFDVMGRFICTLACGSTETLPPGEHRVTFDGNKLASGIYFARLEATPLNPPAKAGGYYVQTRKLMLLK